MAAQFYKGNIDESISEFRAELSSQEREWSDLDMYLAEARFGFCQLIQYLNALEPGARILEVGSGPGLLLRLLSRHYPELSFEGVEPLGDGFGIFSNSLEHARQELDISYCNYQKLPPERSGYALIFSVNVFEHLEDWRHALDFLSRRTHPRGLMVTMCPNYGFPFESHFGIPILLNKKITYFFFQSYIKKFEESKSVHGLWKSLNFVSLRNLEAEAKNLGLRVVIKSEVLSDLIARLDRDANFKSRQSKMGKIASLINGVGLFHLLASPRLRWLHPYMKFEIYREPS